LNKLDEHDRCLLVLYFWRGYTYEDIAATLGCVKSMVCYYMKRALQHAREAAGEV